MWVEWPCGHIDEIEQSEVGELPCPACGCCELPHHISPELAETKLDMAKATVLRCLGDVSVQVCQYLQSRPVLSGDVLYVSPAMWDLIRHADERELQHLLSNLFPVKVPSAKEIFSPEWPMPTIPIPARPFRFGVWR